MFTNSLIYLVQTLFCILFCHQNKTKKACKYHMEAPGVVSRPSQPRDGPEHLGSANALPLRDAGAGRWRCERPVSILATLHSTNREAMKTHFDPKISFL